jgi:competence protein ComEA
MDSFDLDTLLYKYRLPLTLGLLGFILLGLGVLNVRRFLPEESDIEITSPNQSSLISESLLSKEKIVVDIAGAILKPGVYELPVGSRINDLLIAAGGLSSQADRDWVGRNLNLAQKLTDGSKVYLPKRTEIKEGESKSDNSSEKININTASLNQLDTLWGIGPVTARQIITGRPYQTIDELLNKGLVKTNVWVKIKDKITVY